MKQKIDEVGKVPFESTIAGDDPNLATITALTGVVNEHFGAIRDWIKRFLNEDNEACFISVSLWIASSLSF